MANTIQHKRGTAANWTSANPILGAGEFGFETDTGKLKLGDGSTAWTALGYFEPAAAVAAWAFQGENYGYTSGGVLDRGNVIDKFPFAADANATDVADLTVAVYGASGQSSSESGYLSGGKAPTDTNTIQKFSFSTDSNSTDVGDLLVVSNYGSGQSSGENGYHSGGFPTFRNVIQKFPFATDANSTNAGTLTGDRVPYGGGQSSSENGYVVDASSNSIEKFPFASDGNAAFVGTLTSVSGSAGGCQSSTTHGYTCGLRYDSGGYVWLDSIFKNSFAADANATDIANLTQARIWQAGQSSVSSGYTSGGLAPPYSNVIDKFPFSSDTNATDVGDLTIASSIVAGQQY